MSIVIVIVAYLQFWFEKKKKRGDMLIVDICN